jgi:hypothetical protein
MALIAKLLRLIERHRFHQPDEQAAFLYRISAQIFWEEFCRE